MVKFAKRCAKAFFLLCCVFLLLMASRGDTEYQPGQAVLGRTEADRELQGENIGNALTMQLEADREEIDDNSLDSSDADNIKVVSSKEGQREWTLDSPYARAYYAFLQECIINGGTPTGILSGIPAEIRNIRFCLIFIDEDDIPELLIFPDDCHAAGVEVYTYTEGQVVELGVFGSFGKMQYVEKDGMIFDHHMGQGEAHTYFFRMEDREARQVSHLHSWPDYSDYLEGGERREFYEIDEIPVTADIFHAKWEELYDSREYVLIGYEDGIPLNGTELLPTLAQAIENLLWKKDSQSVLEQVEEMSKVLESYGDFLSENAYDSELFTLIYLDNDDVPELVIMQSGQRLAGVEIYTYKQGETVHVGGYGQGGWTWYLEKEGEPDNGAVSEEQYEEAWQKWDSPDKRELGCDYCSPVKGTDIPAALTEILQTLILTRYDVLRENVLIKSGLEEDAILFMDYDDYDGDGIYEAFVFCGESEGETTYWGAFWFVGAEQCTRLPDRHGAGYRKIDGLMRLGLGLSCEQKYLYYYSDYCLTANISGIWTVENGKPVEVYLPQSGQVLYRGDSYRFELWVDSYNNYYEPEGDFWSGHTWRPYFYHYDGETRRLQPDESENLSQKELEEICGFDLAGEVEAAGYEVTAIVRWKQSDIVTINYTIPPSGEDPFHTITYENIIWDCQAGDYWRSEERGVSSWRNAGEGGSI